MRLFHISEESNIEIFYPRIPQRDDMDKSFGVIWAINERCLPNFLTPRNCPRVTYHIGKNTTNEDINKYFTSSLSTHTVIIEHKWFETMQNTTLYLYEFLADDFVLQDEIAGYYIAKNPQKPIGKYKIDNLFEALFKMNVEVRIVNNLWDIANEIKSTSLNWSLCRMNYAESKK